VVAVRVTSEDANDGFKPTCGSIDELSFRTSPDVWGYFSVKSGGGIHEFSDSQVLADFLVSQFPLHAWPYVHVSQRPRSFLCQSQARHRWGLQLPSLLV
jgi:hypothetical protein